MKYFKNPDNNDVHAYEADGSQDEHILPNLVAISEAEALQLAEATKPPLTPERIRQIRQQMFQAEADPLFFKAQRGEASMAQWQDKVEEIRRRVI